MKKIIIKTIFLILAIIIAVGIVFGVTGYSYYKEALEEIPLKEKAAEIRADKNFTKISPFLIYFWFLTVLFC